MAPHSRFVDQPIDEQKACGLFFTAREIARQPDIWGTTLNIFKQNQKNICRFLEELGLQDRLQDRPVVMLVGAGTSDYIGHALKLLLRQKWGCEVLTYASTELLPILDEYIVPGRRYLWISFSRSGDSDAHRPVIDVIFGQLLGLYCSVARGLKPDSPSPSGVISRVVDKFRIY